jgi:hypothetical protein
VSWRGVDSAAATGAALALVMATAYVALMRQQGDQPQLWYLGGLLGGAALAGYGVRTSASHRGAALASSGAVLCALGFLGILSIGAPILLAGALCLAAAAASRRRPAEGS